MGSWATWEMLLTGLLVLAVLWWMSPGLKATWERSRQATHRDWSGALLPIAVVVAFVVLLILLVRQ